MVRGVARWLGVVGALLVVTGRAAPITASELQAWSAQGAVSARAHAVRARALHLQSVLPVAQVATQAPRITRYGAAPAPDSGARPAPASAGPGTMPSSGPSEVAIATDAVSVPPQEHFGIPLGAWIQVTLAHSMSSADPGYAELLVTEPVLGSARTLPVGTKLFAQKEYNQATQRLELRVLKGITPAGREFALQGLVYDPSKMAGLTGIVSGSARQVARAGIGTGLLAAGSAAISQLGAGSVAGSAVSAGAGSVISNTGQWVDQSTQPLITITVAPQPALVQVEDTF